MGSALLGALFVLVIGTLIAMGFLKRPNVSDEYYTDPSIDEGRLRRRRFSGGFYPIGYSGPYLDGEDLVDEAIWFAELEALTEIERVALGVYGDMDAYQVEDPNESNGVYDNAPLEEGYRPEIDPSTEPPEGTAVEEPVVEPPSDVQPVEDTQEEEKSTEDAPVAEGPESTEFEPIEEPKEPEVKEEPAPAPVIEPEPEVVREEDVLNDSLADSWDDDDDWRVDD